MKNSKKYSPKITKLFNSLKRKSTIQPMPQYDDSIDAVVYAIICECVPETSAGRLYRRIQKHFVDLNDLRVSRREEILDVFRDSSPEFEKCAGTMTQILNSIFVKMNRMSLEGLMHDGKRQAHKDLSEIEGMTPFVVSYCFLTSMGGHAIPLTEKMLDYLRFHELVQPNATDMEIAGFLERQIAAADAYDFYQCLRDEAEQHKPVAKTKKAVAKKKVAVKKVATKKNPVKKKTTAKTKTVKK